jgi:hypothetical protein
MCQTDVLLYPKRPTYDRSLDTLRRSRQEIMCLAAAVVLMQTKYTPRLDPPVSADRVTSPCIDVAIRP